MNLLKSIFVPVYMTLLMAISAYGAWILQQGAPRLPWAGVLLTSLPFLLLLVWVMAFKSLARTSARFPGIILLGAAGAVLASSGGAQPTILALTGLGAFLLYSYWYSTYQARARAQLALGEPLPDFTLKAADGSVLRSGDFTGRPTILMFYRGNWCPFCMAQVKELVARYKELAALGARVALVSPQPHENTITLARQFDVDFTFLTDVGNVTARRLGIAQTHGLPMGMQVLGYDSETVLPTVIITDKAGLVLWLHETDNYRVRPEPEIFLEVLRNHAAG